MPVFALQSMGIGRWPLSRQLRFCILVTFLWLSLLAAKVPSVLGQDLQVLFDEPTTEEKAMVLQDWGNRNTTPTDYSVHRTAEAEGFTLSRVSYILDDLQLFGVVRYPRHFDESGSFPVLVLLHGGFSGFWYDFPLSFDDNYPSGCIADSFLVVCPTFRGEGLAGGELLGNAVSDGETSYWDYDCDDAMAMLTAVLENIPAADGGRVVALGQSRGGNVAYHMAIRDSRIRKAAVLFPPSQFREPSVQQEVQDHVDGVQDVTNPLPEKVIEEIVTPYLAGQTTLAQARTHLTAWSAKNFVTASLKLQVHHGDADDIVPILHSVLVDEEMQDQGATFPEYQFFTYPGGNHIPSSLAGYELKVEDFLCYLPSGLSAAPDIPLLPQLQAFPNPFSDRIVLAIGPEVSGKSAINPVFDIFDIRGRRVRTLWGEDPGLANWDGCDQMGRHLPAGSYLATLKGNTQIRPVSILLLK